MKFYFRGSKVDKLPLNDLIAEYSSNGIVKIGAPAPRRGITSLISGLRSFEFKVSEPRQAKCVSSWMDNIVDPNDPFEILKISKIVAIRNSHSILNHLKRLNCLVCSRKSPGFDIPCSDMLGLERGEKVPFTDNTTERFSKSQKLLKIV